MPNKPIDEPIHSEQAFNRRGWQNERKKEAMV